MATWTLADNTTYITIDNGYTTFAIFKTAEIMMTVTEPVLYFNYSVNNALVPAIRTTRQTDNSIARRRFEIDYTDVTSPVEANATDLMNTIQGWLNNIGGGAVADGDYGDITVSGGGSSWTIDNDVVTYAKIQNVSATDKVLGRSTAGAGNVEEITCTSFARTILDDATAADAKATLATRFTEKFCSASLNPASNTSYYFGAYFDTAPLTTANRMYIKMPIACVLREANISIRVSSTLDTAANGHTVAAWINNATAVTLSTAIAANAIQQSVTKTGMSQAISAGDTIEIRVTTPNPYTTLPTGVRISVTLYFE